MISEELHLQGESVTAEVAIINRHAIALAADSAVTVGRDKVWKTANKLFSLGPQHDIAIMVYGAGDYMGLSWELVVKEFRRRVRDAEFRHVSGCAEAFKEFLTTSELFGREDQQGYSVLFPIFDLLDDLPKNTDLSSEIRTFRNAFQSADNSIGGFDESKFKDIFRAPLLNFVSDRFGEDAEKLVGHEVVELSVDFFRSKAASRYHSGVVVAGFGSDEYCPVLSHHIVDGCWGPHLRWWDGENCKDLNTTHYHDEFPIVPFAQDDMSFLFMAGISTDYLDFIRMILHGVVAGALDDFATEFVPADKLEHAKGQSGDYANRLVAAVMEKLFKKVREDQYRPINRAVDAFPKEEMAMMAEALVELTSLKRKVEPSLESVGGPVDVAVISKGDGFIWVKRKHYFDPTKNSDFFARKKRRDVGGAP